MSNLYSSSYDFINENEIDVSQKLYKPRINLQSSIQNFYQQYNFELKIATSICLLTVGVYLIYDAFRFYLQTDTIKIHGETLNYYINDALVSETVFRNQGLTPLNVFLIKPPKALLGSGIASVGICVFLDTLISEPQNFENENLLLGDNQALYGVTF